MATVLTDSRRAAVSASARFTVLLGISVVTPVLGLPQLLAGTIVNATLLVATVLVGPRAAISIGVLPSIFAAASGLLPSPVAPLVPLIMVGNTCSCWSSTSCASGAGGSAPSRRRW